SVNICFAVSFHCVRSNLSRATQSIHVAQTPPRELQVPCHSLPDTQRGRTDSQPQLSLPQSVSQSCKQIEGHPAVRNLLPLVAFPTHVEQIRSSVYRLPCSRDRVLQIHQA